MPKNQTRAAEALHARALLYKFIYSMTGLFVGLVCMLGGVALFLNGVAGSTNWTAKVLGNESTISDAAPGAVLFVVGLFVVIATRYRVTIERSREKGRQRDKISVPAQLG